MISDFVRSVIGVAVVVVVIVTVAIPIISGLNVSDGGQTIIDNGGTGTYNKIDENTNVTISLSGDQLSITDNNAGTSTTIPASESDPCKKMALISDSGCEVGPVEYDNQFSFYVWTRIADDDYGGDYLTEDLPVEIRGKTVTVFGVINTEIDNGFYRADGGEYSAYDSGPVRTAIDSSVFVFSDFKVDMTGGGAYYIFSIIDHDGKLDRGMGGYTSGTSSTSWTYIETTLDYTIQDNGSSLTWSFNSVSWAPESDDENAAGISGSSDSVTVLTKREYVVESEIQATDAAIESMIDMVPIIMIAGLIIGVAGTFLYRRLS